jgi:type IV pilus assembly protein PilV
MSIAIKHPSKNRQGGASLIEVLISMVIIAIGVMGAIGLKIASSRAVGDSNLRSIASIYAQDILERARANKTRAAAGEYNLPAGATPSASPTTIAQTDLAQWVTQLSNHLPDGTGTVNVAAGTATVTVSWKERVPDSNTKRTVTFSFTSLL